MKLDRLEMVPPQALDAEDAVIGSILLDPDALWLATPIIEAEHFYRATNAETYRAMRTLASAGAAWDVLSVRNELARSGCAAAVERLREGHLDDATMTALSVAHHARIVRDAADRRRLIDVADAVVRAAYEGATKAHEIADTAAAGVASVMADSGRATIATLTDCLLYTSDAADE